MMGADGIRIVIELDYGRGRTEQLRVAGGPHVERHSSAEHHVGLRYQFGGGWRREAAGDAERPGVGSEEAIAYGGGRQQAAKLLRQCFEQRTGAGVACAA